MSERQPRPLTERQKEIVKLMIEFRRDHGYMPTVRDTMRMAGIGSTNGIVCHLEAIKKKGYLLTDPIKARGIRFSAKAKYEFQTHFKEFPAVPQGEVSSSVPVTEAQRDVLKAFQRLSINLRMPPSFREMMEELGLRSPNAILGHYKALERKGLIFQEPGRKGRTGRITKLGMELLEKSRGN